MKRAHQKEMEAVVEDIRTGKPIKNVLAKVTPGGGKSALPIIACRLIRYGVADKLCWIAPRQNLQRQGEQNFQDPFFRKMFGHDFSIRSSTNEIDPCRGLDGFITTYQAVGLDSKRTIWQELKSKRYILVLDEFHHTEFEGIWHCAIQPLVDQAKFVLLMTGTLERGSGSRIAFTRYKDKGPGIAVPVTQSTEHTRVIEYNRSQALEEQAIIPMHFSFNDAAATWETESGEEISYDSLHGAGKDARAAIYTSIDTDFAQALLDRCLKHWWEYRRIGNPEAKMLVVTANIKHAKRAVDYLKTKWHAADIATSHNSKRAALAIRRFKTDKVDILVTIAMAYEGMDVPKASHIAVLTHIRSTPWIEQMLARAVRVAPNIPYRNQYAYIFCSDDPLLRVIVSKIQDEQLPYLKIRAKRTQAQLFQSEKKEGSGNPYGIIPLGSSLTKNSDIVIGGDMSGTIDIKTPSDNESELRDQIENHIRRYSFDHRYQNGQINAEIKGYFQKSRSHMTLSELESCLAHVKRVYPLDTYNYTKIEGFSGPRAGRPRVPTKAVPYKGD